MKLLFHPVSQPSRAVTWFLKNNNITDVSLEVVDLLKGAHLSPEFYEKSIYQSVPILELDDGSYLTESAAIINFLASHYNKRAEYPVDPLQAARVHEAQLHHDSIGRLVTTHVFRPCTAPLMNPAVTGDQIRAVIASKADEVAYAFSLLNTILGKTKYIAGNNFTVADYLVICELNQLPFCTKFLPEKLQISNFPNVERYLQDAKEVPHHDEFLATLAAVMSKLNA